MSNNPVLAFIETDNLQDFVAAGGNREVRYETDGFKFGYTIEGLNATFVLPDHMTDPTARERLILTAEQMVLDALQAKLNETRDQDFDTWLALQQLTDRMGAPAGFFDCDGME